MTASPATGWANAKSSRLDRHDVGDLDGALRRWGIPVDVRREEIRVDHAEVTQEAQRRLPGDVRRGALPMLAAFDQQRVARVHRIVEGAVVAQPLAGGMSGVDDDVLRNAHGLRKLEPLALPAGERERRAGVGHRMQVEQEVGVVVHRPQLAGTRKVARGARAVEHVGVSTAG